MRRWFPVAVAVVSTVALAGGLGLWMTVLWQSNISRVYAVEISVSLFVAGVYTVGSLMDWAKRRTERSARNG